MPYLVESLLEVDEDVIEVLLMLKILFTEDSEVEDLFSSAMSCSETCLLFHNGVLCLGFQSIEDDLKHILAWVTDETDCSVTWP